MKKLVTALIIVLPLIFVVAIFAITSVARITANIPATGIVIGNRGDDGTFYFDLVGYKDSPLYEDDLGIEVVPSVAANRNFYLQSVTDAETGEPSTTVALAEDENGKYFDITDIGKVKITYASEDGAFTASVQFVIRASDVIKASPDLRDASGEKVQLKAGADADFEADVVSGDYTLGATCFPDVSPSEINYSSSDETRLSVDALSGDICARFDGSSVVTMKIGKADPVTIKLNVTKAGGTTLEGKDAQSGVKLSAPLRSSDFSFFLQAPAGTSSNDITLKDETGANIDVISSPIEGISGAFRVQARLASSVDAECRKTYTLGVGEAAFRVDVEFAEYRFRIYSAGNRADDDKLLMMLGDSTTFMVSATPKNDRLTYRWEIISAGATVASVKSADGERAIIDALGVGDATLKVYWTQTDEEGELVTSGVIERKLTVAHAYESLSFKETAGSHGAGLLAIAGKRYGQNGEILDNPRELGFIALGKGGEQATSFDDIIFELSDDEGGEIDIANAKLSLLVKKNGQLTLTARWKYGEKRGVSPAKLTFMAVDGISIGEDLSPERARDDLTRAMNEGKKTVLERDVYLGEDLYERDSDGKRLIRNGRLAKKVSDSEGLDIQRRYVKELPTTWDWQFYKNNGQAQPTVKYALEIKGDIFGNGHQINAEYLTNTLDETDKPTFSVFSGPLDFVAAGQTASVKGQDNIIFLVREEGLTLDNVTLKGCDDQSLYDADDNGNPTLNLSLLSYTGTTLEIMNDATVRNCRVANGRTVVRIFGKAGVDADSPVNVEEEKINVLIEGCTLQNAREFLLKMGTNRIIRSADYNAPSPALKDANGNDYANFNSAACDEYINDEYFINRYLLTEVTLRDSTLSTSGLFAIGMESHFAGKMLADGPSAGIATSLVQSWKGLAGTSYPALLHLEGRVELADWKPIDNVDSSTLIELSGSGGAASFLRLDIKALVDFAFMYDKDRYGNLIDVVKGDNGDEKCVHGGIAFYGGGKNYHMLDMSGYTFYPMSTYTMNLSMLENSYDANISMQGSLLPLAAGEEDFRFVMFDATSEYRYKP